MTRIYELAAKGSGISTNPSLVDYVGKRFATKNLIWQQRNDVLVDKANALNLLISIYSDTQGLGVSGLGEKSRGLLYRSAMAHQVWNTLQGSKLEPDYLSFTPLMNDFDPELLQKSRELTQAHRIMRSKGGFDKAKLDAKADLIWGNSFIQMGVNFNKQDKPQFVEYSHAPFHEVRGMYGDTDMIRAIDYPIDKYAGIYGEDMLDKVTSGGITTMQDENLQQDTPEQEYKKMKDRIQVVFYYDPFRKIFAEIHGGSGYIFQSLEDEDYPFMGADGNGFAPFKEARFYEGTSNKYFGWGPMDYIIDLAELETTITNATAHEAVWESSAPTFISSNDPDDMDKKIDRWMRDRARGINRPIIQKDTGIGTKGNISTMKKGVENGNMQVWDNLLTSRATRFTNIDLQSLTDFAPTAEQQKLKKLEADKLNLRVLLLNEEREKQFAVNEMYFLRDGITTAFHNKEIGVVDGAAEEFQTADGYKPVNKKKIRDILKGTKDLEMKIEPRMEGALDDMSFIEIQTLQADLSFLQPGTAAYSKGLEKYFAKKNPDLELKREDFEMGGPIKPGQPPLENEKPITDALSRQLAPNVQG